MTTGFEMFLLAAREMNFSRAAEIAYVTPQCLSDHIKRIEDHYGVTLFIRRPHLQLTEEGRTMVRYLTRIRTLEGNMENELADVSGGTRGTLNLGVPSTRGSILIPSAVEEFREFFPNVEVEVRLSDTHNLEEMLLSGTIDLFLGVATSQNALFKRHVLFNEALYLVVSRLAMQEQFGDRYEAVRDDFLLHGADMSQLRDISFVQGHRQSTTTITAEQMLLRQNISYSFPIRVSNFDLHIDFCRRGKYASICTLSHLRRVIDSPHEELEIYGIRNSWERLEIAMIEHRDSPALGYRTRFAEILGRHMIESDNEVLAWLRKRHIVTPVAVSD